MSETVFPLEVTVGRYLVFDIGCLECGEASRIVDTCYTREAAWQVGEVAALAQRADWHGQHDFAIFDLETGERDGWEPTTDE